MVNCRIYSIEGNIGSGKSTLVTLLKKYYENQNFVFLDEPVDEWNTIKDKSGETILSKFYADQDKYAFSFQMMAYISRIAKLRQALRDNRNSIIITERSVLTDKNVFAKMLYDDNKIEEVNYRIYLQWFDEFTREIPSIGVIYVKASPEVCHTRVIHRGREGEEIPLAYLQNCHSYHSKWLEGQPTVLTLDANEDKSETIAAYTTWIRIINSFIRKKSFQFVDIEEHANICCDTHAV